MYNKYTNTTSSPATVVFPITASATPLAIPTKAIRADGAGTVTFIAVDSTSPVTMTLAAGEILPVRVRVVTAFTVSALHGLA
jgi:hypothetical protein